MTDKERIANNIKFASEVAKLAQASKAVFRAAMLVGDDLDERIGGELLDDLRIALEPFGGTH